MTLEEHRSSSAILMYNLALSFHLRAIRYEEQQQQRHDYNQNEQQQAEQLYKKAHDLYVMSAQTSIRTRRLSAAQEVSPIRMVVLHNLSLVYHAMQEDHEEEASKCQSQLAHLLRRSLIVVCTNTTSTNTEKRYEASYIKLLSFQSKSTTMSVAA